MGLDNKWNNVQKRPKFPFVFFRLNRIGLCVPLVKSTWRFIPKMIDFLGCFIPLRMIAPYCISNASSQLTEYFQGTASSQTDRFKYADRGFEVGHLYAFGLAVNFSDVIDGPQVDQVLEVLSSKLGWNVILVQEPVQFFVICINRQLENFLLGRDLKCVPLLDEKPFREVLSTEPFVKILLQRDFEGFVLSSQNLILKWKSFEEDERTSQRDALTILKNRLTDQSLSQVLATLEEVCFSSAPEDKQNLGPRRRPTKALYAQLFNSASSKFPTLADAVDAEKSTADDDKLMSLVRDYESTIYVEMAKDFVDAGYKLDEDYEKELRGNLRAKVKSEASKVLKKKLNFGLL